ncbi:MAG: Fe-S protein assembly co-chaperone HscB [Burkholderiales bacterium]|nr:Fe-S protein assembly co-chaperone HscB [Burkholderiales bacterium]
MQSYFELFGIEPGFALERTALERAYREIQGRIHPDRFAHAGDAERRASMQWTTRINEAYRVLLHPLERARHLLELNGVDVELETNTAMPAEFLERQMTLREALETASAARDPAALDALRADLGAERRRVEAQIGERIDGVKDYAGAAGLVRELKFLERLDEEIASAYESIEA